MAHISANGANGHHVFNFHINETSVDTTNNTSKVAWSFNIQALQNGWDFYKIGSTIKIVIDGKTVYDVYAQRDFGGSGYTIWAEGETTIEHNGDGSKHIGFSFSYSQSSTSSYTPGNASNSGSMSLTTIPRYASISNFSVSKRDETSVKFDFSVDATCDWAWYSKDNGSTWSNLPNTNIVSGLSANTSYKFKMRVRRADSQLTTDSGTKEQTTYDYPHPTSTNDFTIGEGASVGVYNPLHREYTLELISRNNNSVIGSYTGTYEGTVNAEFKTTDAINKQYASIPNSDRGTYYAKVTYGNSQRTKGDNTYYINYSNSLPVFTNFEFEDTNQTIINLTGDSSKFVLGKSNLRVKITTSNKATPRNYATMKEYQLGNDTNNKVAYNSNSTVYLYQNAINSSEITVLARDSRTLTTPVTKQLNNVGYTIPIIDILNSKAIRNNNGVGSQVTLSFDGTYWNKSFGLVTNKIKKLTYKFKKSDLNASFSEEFDITENISYNNNEFRYENLIKGDSEDLGFDISESYNIVVYYEDELTSGTFSLILKSGTPNIAIAKNGVAIKGKYDNELGGALQVYGDLIINDGKIIDNSGRDGVILYENSSGTTGTVILNDNTTYYNKLIIEYKSNYSGRIQSVTVFIPNGATVNTSFIDGLEYGSTSYYRSSSVFIIGNYIYRNDGQSYDTYNKNPTTMNSSSDHYPYITRVIGYNNESFKIGNEVGY